MRPSKPAAQRIEDILKFWFGAFPDAWSSDLSKVEMWFKNGLAFDQEIATCFGPDYRLAAAGEYGHWVESPRGRLALIILLDQFSRHIHRGTAAAFAQDAKAQALCLQGMDKGHDLKLHPVERSFFYLPLEHAEDLQKQENSVEAFKRLIDDVPSPHKQPFEISLEWAEKHHYVIEQFGRFPELNEILERQSTPEETAFLNQGSHRFL